jgi:hypothetical protein
MDEIEEKRCASVMSNTAFISVMACRYYRRIVADHRLCQHLLPPDAGDEALGNALTDALANSRKLSSNEIGQYFDLGVLEENYRDWTADLMARYGYQTKRALFSKMKNCSVAMMEGVITIQPHEHVKLDAWRGISEGDVVIPDRSSPAKTGAALRLALSRCSE